ncbi:MAG: FG-GAP repeat protein [Phycisphaeraceae bacterium]|nr:FG-GAP repeat protein [Phycisphaeraceae bacterium]
MSDLQGQFELSLLEPRVLLAAYTFDPFTHSLNLPSNLGSFVPPQGVEVANFGAAAAAIGDIDGDGVDDIAISAPGQQGEQSSTPGRVFLYSGATRQIIRTLEDGFVDFGVSIASIGDIDNDGRPDLLVGSPLVDLNANALVDPTGAAYIYSGADGSMLRFFQGPTAFSEFGRAVAALGDVTGDSFVEVLIGAPGGGPSSQGVVLVITTALTLLPVPNPEVIRTLAGEAAGDRFGAAVISAGDIPPSGQPGDGVPDIFIGAPLHDGNGAGSGRAYLYSGADGSLRLILNGERADDRFGAALGVGIAGSTPFLYVGAPNHDWQFSPEYPPISDTGRIYRFDAQGQLAEASGPIAGGEGYHLGIAISALGDINGDGRSDFAVSQPGAPAGQRISFRNSGFSELAISLPGGATGDIAFAAGDLDHDGQPDVLVTTPGANSATAFSSLGVVQPIGYPATNDDRSFMFFSSLGNSVGGRADYAIVNGMFANLRMLPGIGSDGHVIAVNNAGLIVGRIEITDSLGNVFEAEPFLVQGGTRTLLSALVTQIIGGITPEWANLKPIRLANDGSLILHEQDGPSISPTPNDRSWLYKDGVLTLLWNGSPIDVNDSGAVLGSRRNDDLTYTVILRTPDGTVTPISELTQAYALNNEGVIVGSESSGSIVTWHNGVVTVVAPYVPPIYPTTYSSLYATDINDAGDVLVVRYTVAGRGTNREYFVVRAGESMALIYNVVFGDNPVEGTPSIFVNGRDIYTGYGVAEPIDERAAWSLVTSVPVSAAAGTSIPSSAVVGVNPYGNAILFWDDAQGITHGTRLTLGTAATGTITDVVAYADPTDSSLYVVVFGALGAQWFIAPSPLGDGAPVFPLGPAFPIPISNPAVFFTTDHRVLIAGAAANGDLILYFQNGLSFPSSNYNWSSSNITVEHIQARGQTFIPIASNLTAFSTAWNANHVAYLDAEGQVHAVWWAPGSDPLWRTDQLTSAAAAGPLEGRLSSFVTPWNTLHINAFNQAGEAVAVWWDVSFGGQWAVDALAAPGSARFDPASVTSFQTPWNALHLIGRDADTGEILTYWWAPATGEWRVETIHPAAEPEGFAAGGLVYGLSGPTGLLALYTSRASNGNAVRIAWTLEDPLWRFSDLTELVIA